MTVTLENSVMLQTVTLPPHSHAVRIRKAKCQRESESMGREKTEKQHVGRHTEQCTVCTQRVRHRHMYTYREAKGEVAYIMYRCVQNNTGDWCTNM